jgi:hypothetical protein
MLQCNPPSITIKINELKQQLTSNSGEDAEKEEPS